MNHELDTIRSFIKPTKRERYIEFIANERHRAKFTKDLAHFKDFDGRYRVEIAPARHHPEGIASLLRAKGAGAICWAISEYSRLDAREMKLDEALREVVGKGMGTILSCIPGCLAFVETENERFILERLGPRPKRVELVRFVAQEIDSESHCEEGIFQAVARLRNSGTLPLHEQEALYELRDWFSEHLDRPTLFSRTGQQRGICWFKPHAKDCMTRVWEMVRILQQHGIHIRKITTDLPGFVVYEDDIQVVAEPFRDGTFT